MNSPMSIETALRDLERRRNEHVERERRLRALSDQDHVSRETISSRWHVVENALACRWRRRDTPAQEHSLIAADAA